ncbi:MAG: restriction endonuclease [Euryarchaeota archaeon]|nr:restriction endonuclease [Euryarchaeota archaeon]
MPNARLVDVLGEVFRTYGFDTTRPASPEGMSRARYEVDLIAEKSGMDVLVAVTPDPGAIDLDAVDRHARMVHDVGAYYGLIVSPAGFTDAAYHHATRTKTILWDRDAIEAAIGRAVLFEVLGDRHDPPVAEVLGISPRHAPEPMTETEPAAEPEAMFPFMAEAAPEAETPATPPAEAADPMGFLFADDASEEVPAPSYTSSTPTPVAVTTGTEHGRGWVLQTGRQREDAPRAPDRPTGLASLAAMGGARRHGRGTGPDPRVFNPTDGALVAPGVSKESAAKKARDLIYTIDHTYLRYHPKRVFDWTVEAFVEGRVETTTLAGHRVVDLATRDVHAPKTWDSPRHLREGTFDVAVDHKPVRLETEKARDLVLESILEETARQITVEDFDRALDIMITEKRRVRAHRDDVRIEDRGLHWCPVWCFVGVNGEVEVDGMTGEVTERRLETPAGSTMLI